MLLFLSEDNKQAEESLMISYDCERQRVFLRYDTHSDGMGTMGKDVCMAERHANKILTRDVFTSDMCCWP